MTPKWEGRGYLRLQLRKATTLIILSGLLLILTIVHKANANQTTSKNTILVVNPLHKKKLVLVGHAEDGLHWIAKHGLKRTTTVGLYYKNNIYRSRKQVISIARKLYLPRITVYVYRGKVAPQAFVIAVNKYFGKYASQAMRVAFCESGWYLYASNGQYQGPFQMGSGERARYGDGASYDAKVRAASRYFFASGADWSPWQCKP